MLPSSLRLKIGGHLGRDGEGAAMGVHSFPSFNHRLKKCANRSVAGRFSWHGCQRQGGGSYDVLQK